MTSPAAANLDRLRTITEERARLDAEQYAAVLDARLNRATWAEIAAALGVTPQAAQKRYHGTPH